MKSAIVTHNQQAFIQQSTTIFNVDVKGFNVFVICALNAVFKTITKKIPISSCTAGEFNILSFNSSCPVSLADGCTNVWETSLIYCRR